MSQKRKKPWYMSLRMRFGKYLLQAGCKLVIWVLLSKQGLIAQNLELIHPNGVPAFDTDFIDKYSKTLTQDIEGDGDLDLIISIDLDHFFTYENDGNGNFKFLGRSSFEDIINGKDDMHLEFADFNGDTYQDFIIDKTGDNDLKMYLGDSSGGFTLHNSGITDGVSDLNLRTRFIIEDIDSDGDLDVFLSRYERINIGAPTYTFRASLNVLVYLNDGSGVFTSETLIADSETLGAEIAISNTLSGNRRNLFVRGDFEGSGLKTQLYQYDGVDSFDFISDSLFSEGIGAEIYLGDFNGDSQDDVVIASDEEEFRFFMFEDSVNYTYHSGSTLDGFEADHYAFSDVDQDGGQDVVAITVGPASGALVELKVYLSDSTGGFSESQTFPSYLNNAGLLILADFTGDGYPEIINHARPKTILGSLVDIREFYLNQGDGLFIRQEQNLINQRVGGNIAVADFDGDKDHDILINGTPLESETVHGLYVNDSAGSFTTRTDFSIEEEGHSLVIDYDRDGDQDLLVNGFFYDNDGSGFFTKSDELLKNAGTPNLLKFHSNNDFEEDILICGFSTYLFQNYGAKYFRRKESYQSGLADFKNAIADAGDLDNDGDMDLILTGSLNAGGIATYLYANDGSGYFNEIKNTGIQGVTNGDVKLACLDDDKNLDIIVAGNGYLLTYLSEGTAYGFSLNQSLEGFSKATIATEDVDKDGDVDFVVTGYNDVLALSETKLYLNDGDGLFTASDLTFRGVQDASVVWADIDQDFDKDLLISGMEILNSYTPISRVYRNKSNISVIAEKVSSCDNYIFYGDTLTISGSYSKSITTLEGSVRTINLDLTIGQAYNDTIILTASEYYHFDGKRLITSGNYHDTLISSTGCDSIVMLDLTIENSVHSEDISTIGYELTLPKGSPQIHSDFEVTRGTGSTIYDMDGDGDNDFLMFGQNSQTDTKIISYLNQGDGKFTRVDHDLSFPKQTFRPIVKNGDLNGDGIDDLIIGGEKSIGSAPKDFGTHVYFGDSLGGLILQSDIVLPSSWYGAVELIDFTGDGVLDIFLVGIDPVGVWIYKNDGTGGFTDTLGHPMTVSFPLGGAVSKPYNGGVIDIIVVDYSVYKLYRFDGTSISYIGDNVFSSDRTPNIYFNDANADGAPDVFTGKYNSSDLYINDGSGNYMKSSETFNGVSATDDQIRFVDLNNDNAAEVILDVTPLNADFLHVFWNDGAGNFPTTTTYPMSNYLYEIVVGDLSGDGYPDIFFNGDHDNKEWIFTSLINDQSNDFDEVVYSSVSYLMDGDNGFVDIDQDGDLDLIATGQTADEELVTEMYLNDGEGDFSLVPMHPVDSLRSSSMAFADIDGNGTQDMVISGTDSRGKTITKLYKNDSGEFILDTINLVPLTNGAIAFIELNDDNKTDLFTVGTDSTGVDRIVWYLNDGIGGFSQVTNDFDGIRSVSLATGDLNGDDLEDILICGKNSLGISHTMEFISNGDGSLTQVIPSPLKDLTGAVAIGDVDGDLDNDIYLAGLGFQEIYLNNGKGSFTLGSELEGVTRVAAQFADVDLDHDLDLIVSGIWSETKNKGTYVLANDGDGNFSKWDGDLFGVYDGSLQVADIDGDLDLDFITAGVISEYTQVTRVYRNTICSGDIFPLDPVVSTVPYDFYGTTLSTSGTYQHILTTLEGCSRTVSLNFSMLNQWTGATDSSWNEPSNWSLGTHPTVGDDVKIVVSDNDPWIHADVEVDGLVVDPNVTITVHSGSLKINGDIINDGVVNIGNGASMVNYGEIKGEGIFSVTKNTTHSKSIGKYSYLGSPVEQGLFDSIGRVHYYYDEALEEFKKPAGLFMEPGRGYASAFTGKVMFSGKPNTDEVSISISKTDYPSGNDSDEGYNMVANPYPCAIDFMKFVSKNLYDPIMNPTGTIMGSIWVWDDNESNKKRGSSSDYLTINALGVIGGLSKNAKQWSGYLGTGQGFFVKASPDSSLAYGTHQLVFNDSMKTTGYNQDSSFFRTRMNNSILLSLFNDQQESDETLIGFRKDATGGIDALYDAYKIDSEQGLRLFSLMENTHLAIQGREFNAEEIEIGFHVEEAGSHHLVFDDTKTLDYGIWLIDKFINKRVNLLEQSVYEFQSTAGTFEDRFVLFTNRQSQADTDSPIHILLSDRELTVTGFEIGESIEVMVTDFSGKRLFHKTVEKTSIDTWSSKLTFQTGIYIIRVNTSKHALTRKYWIK